MEDLRQLVQEEGREARNIVAFHVTVDTPASRVSRKPPIRTGPMSAGSISGVHRKTIVSSGASVNTPAARRGTRSASAGRDKRSELQARYWALLFGNLQRAVGEIYNTVEAHENLSECQEVILVLENYTRDFKALCEWFRLKWEYDNTPPPQRPLSLAWEVRKTDFVRPESRKTSSGKSSPSLSGKSSPNISPSLTSGKMSPKMLKSSGCMSPKSPQNKEFSALKYGTAKNDSKVSESSIPVKITEEPPLNVQEPEEQVTIVKNENDEVKEVIIKDISEDLTQEQQLCVEIGTAVEFPSLPVPKKVVSVTRTSRTAKLHESPSKLKPLKSDKKELSSQARLTTNTLNQMETNFLRRNSLKIDTPKEELVTPLPPVNTQSDVVQPQTDDLNKPQTDLITAETDSIESHPDLITPQTDLVKPLNDMAKPETDLLKPQTDPITPEKNISPTTDDKCAGTHSVLISVSETSNGDKQITDVQHKNDVKTGGELEICSVASNGSAKPAYSQAAAKPKSSTLPKECTNDKVPTKITKSTVGIVKNNQSKNLPTKADTSRLARSKTMTEIRQTRAGNSTRTNVKSSYPFNSTLGRSKLFEQEYKANRYSNNTSEAVKSQRTFSNRIQSKDKKDNLSPKFRNDTDKMLGKNKLNSNPEKKTIVDITAPVSESNANVNLSIDLTRIQSNESIKTLIPDSSPIDESFSESLESLTFLRMDDSNASEDGWLTVKSKRLGKNSQPKKSSSHWAERFNQPSATASLPTLAMLESPSSKDLDQEKAQNPVTPLIKPKTSKDSDCKKVLGSQKDLKMTGDKTKDRPLILRQRSDLVRSKTKNLVKRKIASGYDKQEPSSLRSVHLSSLMKKRLHSSLESLDTASGPGRISEKDDTTSTDDSFEKSNAKMKSLKIRIDSFRRSDRKLSNTNYIKKADLLEIAAMTSQIEENERKISIALDLQSEEDQRKLSEEEDRLNQEIKELQQCDIDVDTETDDTETDAEIIIEELNVPDDSGCDGDPNDPRAVGSGSEDCLGDDGDDSLEARYEPVLAGLSWDERVDTLAALEALVARHPGRAQQLHAKLSQGMRRRGSLQETLKRYQQKQERAQQQRQELQEERTKKLHQLLARVEDVKAAKNQLIEEKRLRMEQRLQKAAENRDQHLKDIVRKAHDEDEKLREILFIKQLQAEQARHEILAQVRRHTSRMRQLRRERLRRLEQLVARRAAAGARRSALEAARGGRLRALLERRRQRHERARDKRDQVLYRSQRLSAALSNKQAVEDLQVEVKRPKGKSEINGQNCSTGRHNRKAKNKKEEGKRLQNGNINNKEAGDIKDESTAGDIVISKEKMKAQKKKIRKFKQKIIARGEEYECSYEPPAFDQRLCTASHLQRPIQQISGITQKYSKTYNQQNVAPNKMEGDAKSNSAHSSMSDLSKAGSKNSDGKKGAGNANQLDRTLSELARALQKRNPADKLVFLKLGGFNVIGGVLAAALEGDCTDKTVMTLVPILSTILCGFLPGCEFFLRSNRMLLLLDLINQKMAKAQSLAAAYALADCASIPLELINARKHDLETSHPDLMQRTHTIVSYACASGVVAVAGRRASPSCHRLIASLAEASLLHRDDYSKSHLNDNSARGDMARELRSAELCGVLAALQSDPEWGTRIDSEPGGVTVETRLRAALTLINAAARVDVKSFQESLGGESEGIQFRTAASRLLAKYAPTDSDHGGAGGGVQAAETESLLHDLIAAIGYFVVNNEKNQEVLSGGDPPGSWCARRLSCLPARLCTPGRVGSDARGPAAIAALARCSRARDILLAEINVQVLEEFVWSDAGNDVPLVIMLRTSQRRTSQATPRTV